MSNSFYDDIFGSLGRPGASAAAKPSPEKGVQIRGHKIDGVFYVRADDVVALLDANKVLPGIVAKLRKAAR